MTEHAGEQRTTAPDGRPESEQPAWRRDFPIDVPQDHYVARRDFTRFLGLTSLAFVVGQLWIGVENWRRQRQGLPPVKPIASLRPDHENLPYLSLGGALTFAYPDEHDSCLLLRPSADAEPVAYSQKCTHLSCAVVPDVAGGRLHCPCHRGLFDLTSGRPLSGPPRRPLSRITLEVRDGVVYATGVELRTV